MQIGNCLATESLIPREPVFSEREPVFSEREPVFSEREPY